MISILKPFVIVFTIITGLVYASLFCTNYSSEKQKLVDTNYGLLSSIDNSLLHSLHIGDHIEVGRLLSGLIKTSNVGEIYLLSDANELIFSYPPSDNIYTLLNKYNFVPSNGGESSEILDGILVTHKLISQPDSPKYWKLTIIYSLNSLKLEIFTRLGGSILVLFALLGTIYVMLIYFLRSRLGILSVMLEQIRLISKGKYKLELVDEAQWGALKELVQAFNKMRKNYKFSTRGEEKCAPRSYRRIHRHGRARRSQAADKHEGVVERIASN